MAGLISTGIWGFICSILPTGKRDEKGKMIMEEHFLSGFAGWGWKIWKTVAGFFRLEIDELVVRRTMTVFELLIQKIRAIKGAMAITQANGKIKTAVLSDDGTAYLITLEEDDMSFVEYDYIRCQEFSGGQKFYHVEIESVEGGVIRVPISEFEGSSLPSPGDEIVQFGNSSRDAKYAGRHSAIYMHADESGQPAIDVMFDIYSKDWANCVKVRVGGDIPGTNGLKGFYCENGMIKCVATDGHTTYCLHPDGTAELGDGAAIFRPDKSGHIAGGAIKWAWNEDKQKYVCTMGDVLLSWDNLDDETKENLKGVPGKPGADGKVLYTWIRYADTSTGSGISNNPTGKLYIGLAYNKESATESNTPSDYAWSLIKGGDGEPGAPGADGKTTYTWISYSDNADGSGMYQLPNDNTKYIGIAVNKDTKTEGTNPADYTWSKFRGTDGKPGTDANLLPWIEKWNGYATELGEEYIVTPKMFSGTKSADGKLTGIAQGKDCITIDGVKRTGIFALVNNEVVFKLDPISKTYLFRGRVEADAGTFTGEMNADSGTIGGFEIANGRIGAESSASGRGGGLSITDNFLRVGGNNGYVMIGEDVIPASAGGAFTAAGRVVNNHPNTGAGWGYDTANYGLFIDVSGGTQNFGLCTNAPLMAPAYINTRVKTVTFGGGYSIDFAQASIFLFYSSQDTNMELPSESAVAKMFGMRTLPEDFGFIFHVRGKAGSSKVILNGVYDFNDRLTNDYAVRGGDIAIVLVTKSPSFRYQIISYSY